MTRARIMAIVAVGTLALGACNGDGDADPTTTPSTASSPVTPGTTEATSTPTTTLATTVPPTSPPTVPPTSPPTTSTDATVAPTSTPGEATDWRAIIQRLGRTRQELYASPDVSRIGEVCAGESQCFRQLDVQLDDLADDGWRVVGADPYTVLEATVETFDGDTIETSMVVTIIDVVQRPAEAGRIVDANGDTVADVEPETREGFNSEGRTVLARVGPARNPWRIVSQERIREVPA